MLEISNEFGGTMLWEQLCPGAGRQLLHEHM